MGFNESETARINRAASKGLPITIDWETARLLNMAFKFYRLSNGLFDITSGILRKAWNFSAGVVPSDEQVHALLPLVGMGQLLWHERKLQFKQPGMELDFGGIAKEYARSIYGIRVTMNARFR
jgi:FAD:protein FMN transferase